jgi:hypothetical protein
VLINYTNTTNGNKQQVQLESRGRRAAEEANKGLQVEADNARQAVRDLQVKVDKAESEVYYISSINILCIKYYATAASAITSAVGACTQ